MALMNQITKYLQKSMKYSHPKIAIEFSQVIIIWRKRFIEYKKNET
jgi:hypothetical protein